MIIDLKIRQYHFTLEMAADWISLISAMAQATLTAIEHITNQKEIKKQDFFAHYRKHSEQLVTALQVWGQGLQFTSCEYEGGQLCTNCSEHVEPSDISYMEEMKKHLERRIFNYIKSS